MALPPPTRCAFCNKEEVLWALYDWIGYRPACGDCAVEYMGQYHEIVDALAVWPVPKGSRG